MLKKRGSFHFRWKSRADSKESKIPAWKERYRERCKERLRDSRYKHLVEKRKSDSSNNATQESDVDGPVRQQDMKDRVLKDIENVMNAEWELMQKEEGIFKQEDPLPLSIDEKIALMEDILEELKGERLQQCDEKVFCEEFVRAEEEELCQAFDRLNSVEVICPLCQKGILEEASGIISCKCGLKINTEQDCISLKFVSDNLHQGTRDHSQRCECSPSFSQVNDFGISTLTMTCRECDFFFIIV